MRKTRLSPVALVIGPAIIAGLLFSSSATGREPSKERSLDSEAFRPVVIDSALLGFTRTAVSPIPIHLDFPEITHTPVLPPLAIPTPEVKVAVTTPKPMPKPKPKPSIRQGNGWMSGSATFYCNNDLSRYRRSACHNKYPDKVGSSQYYAAASHPLQDALGKNWRNKLVTVWFGKEFVTVKLIDSCWCPNSNKIVDLYADPFEDLAGWLGRGRVAIKVTW